VTTPFVFVVAPLSPPMNGVATSTEGVLDYLRPRVRVRVANVSPGLAGGAGRHIAKARRILLAIAGLVANAAVSGRVVYMSADGGAGKVYNLVVAACARGLGYRVFVHHHSFAYIDRRSRLTAVLAWVMGPKGIHIVLCPDMAAGFSRRYPGTRTFELSNAALLPGEVERLPRPLGPGFRIGFLSNLIVEKGLDTSIDLLRAVRGAGLPAVLILAGGAPDRRALNLVKAARMEFGDALIHLGPVAGAAKSAFFADLDVFCFPSRYANEAQPHVLLEALAHGVPVLTFARSCITADMGDGAGLCVPKGHDFVGQALALIQTWSRDREALAAASRQARGRAEDLRETGLRQLAALVEAFASNA
jgi:glycosyltransferase involved in cell wall biosynthesis